MSSLLEQAIVDATALKEAAMKNAEKNLVEKYSSKIKEAVDKLLEQDDAAGMEAAPLEASEADPADALQNTPSDLTAQPEAAPVVPPTPKDPLEKVKPSYLKSKGDDELITIDFSSLKAKPVGNLQAGATLPVAPVAPITAPPPAAAAAAPPAAPLAENLRQYESDDADLMEEEELEEDASFDEADMEEETTDEMVEIDINEAGCGDGMEEGDCMEEGGYPAEGMGGEPLGAGAMYREEYDDQEESGAYPEEGMEQTEEEVSLEEELMVDMDVVSDGWRGMQPNEKRELMNVALAKEKDEEYQRQMAEYQEASEEKIKKTSTKNKALVKENEELKQTLMNLKEHIEGMNLSNAKLLYMNRVLGSPSFNERQKEQIVESISRTETVEAAKIAFETLQSAVGSSKKEVKAPKSLNEAVSRSSSPFLVRKKETGESPVVDRMKKLAGIIKD
jgi:hypothetical protein